MTETSHRPAVAPAAELDVVVAVGTDTHPFDRLMTWLETWHAARADGPHLLVQHGRSRAPDLVGATAFLAHDQLVAAMARARVVVTHGGPASIAEAWRHGHRPLVVPRDPAYGEHVDNHQILFTARMAVDGLIRVCTSADEFAAALDAALGAAPTRHDLAGPGSARAIAVANVGRIVDGLITGGRRIPRPRRAEPGRPQ